MTLAVRKALLIGLTSILAFVSSSALVSAQATQGLQLKPAVIEDNVTPGQVYRTSLTITNISDTSRTFSLSAEDILGIDQGGNPIFATANSAPTGFELSSWVALPSGFVTLEPNESKRIDLTINVPSSASPGSHFGGIFLNTDVQRPDVNGAAVGFKVGGIVSLRIAGDVREEARLREFSTDKLVYNSASVVFSSKFENLGNVLLRPHGLIEVSNMFGKKVGQVEVNAAAAAVFPESFRIYGATWNDDGFAFGRYQAIVSMVYGQDGQKTVSGTTSFWVLPLKPIAIMLGSILVIVALFYAFVRSYIRRKLRSMGVPDTRADSTMYARRYGAGSSRLMMLVIGIALVCLLILAILFLLFA